MARQGCPGAIHHTTQHPTTLPQSHTTHKNVLHPNRRRFHKINTNAAPRYRCRLFFQVFVGILALLNAASACHVEAAPIQVEVEKNTQKSAGPRYGPEIALDLRCEAPRTYYSMVTPIGFEPEKQKEDPTKITEQDQMPRPNIGSFQEWKESKTQNNNKNGGSAGDSANETETPAKPENPVKTVPINATETVESGSSEEKKSEGKESSKDEVSGEKQHNNNKGAGKPSQKVENYASSKCGAKILSHSAGENFKGVIEENQDVYMKAKCSDLPITFVIELCEPTRLKEFQLGNYELFSSSPKRFRLAISENAVSDANSWVELDDQEFIAEDKPGKIQKFPIKSQKVDGAYFKYVRVEILEVHGEEIFCPVTYVGVMGRNWLMQQYIDPNDENKEPEEEETPESDTKKDEPVPPESNTILGKVKEIVKKALPAVSGTTSTPPVTTTTTEAPATAQAPVESELEKSDEVTDFPSMELPEGPGSKKVSPVHCDYYSLFAGICVHHCEKCSILQNSSSSSNVSSENLVQNLADSESEIQVNQASGSKSNVDGTAPTSSATKAEATDSSKSHTRKPVEHSKDVKNGKTANGQNPPPKVPATPDSTKQSNGKDTANSGNKNIKELHRPENVVMIFNNRLKKAEENLDDTNVYLQELSSQYKTQMDSIRAVHNRTLMRLTGHIEQTALNTTNLAKQIQVLQLKIDKEMIELRRQVFWLSKRLSRLQNERRRDPSLLFSDAKIQRWVSKNVLTYVTDISGRDVVSHMKHLEDTIDRELKKLGDSNYNDPRRIIFMLVTHVFLTITLQFIYWIIKTTYSSLVSVFTLPFIGIKKTFGGQGRRSSSRYRREHRLRKLGGVSMSDSRMVLDKSIRNRMFYAINSASQSSLPVDTDTGIDYPERMRSVSEYSVEYPIQSLLDRIEKLEKHMLSRQRAEDSFSEQITALRRMSKATPGQQLRQISKEIAVHPLGFDDTTQDEGDFDDEDGCCTIEPSMESIIENDERENSPKRPKSVDSSNSESQHRLVPSGFFDRWPFAQRAEVESPVVVRNNAGDNGSQNRKGKQKNKKKKGRRKGGHFQ